MKTTWILRVYGAALLLLVGCRGQTQDGLHMDKPARIGGECEEGYCELLYYGIPPAINAVDTSAGWFEEGQRLIVSGVAYKLDGRTPAANVTIYYHHTDNEGYYSPRNDRPENQTRHGHIRGWVRTDKEGRYSIYTIRPAPYPDKSQPAHIHWLVKEPELQNEYWTDDLMFDDDKLLLPFIKKNQPRNFGGSGIARVLVKDSIQIAEHNFVLGLNVPNYPEAIFDPVASGLDIGIDQPSFGPRHAWGPDKGTRTCPVCKYGRYHGILYFVGRNPDWEDVKKWLLFLDSESAARQQYLKVFFVYGNDRDYNQQNVEARLVKLGSDLKLKQVALTYVPSFMDRESDVDKNNINPDARCTFVVYRNGNIVDKFINLKPDTESFDILTASLDRTKGIYFDLQRLPIED